MNQIDAARAVLIEVTNLLGAFEDSIVIVGGWVPDLKYPEKNHIGSLDVDLAVGPEAAAPDAYSSIHKRLTDNDYDHEVGPTRFYRNVPGAKERVKVDMITGQYVTDKKTRAIHVNELKVNSLRGIDLAFENCEEIEIQGAMPNGAQNVVRAWMVRPEAFILIKAFAMADRKKEKDAYDIAFVLHNYDPSIAKLAAALFPLIADGLGAEAYKILTEKFATLESVGPDWAAQVAEENGQDRQQAQQAVFQDAQELFDEVGKIQDSKGET